MFVVIFVLYKFSQKMNKFTIWFAQNLKCDVSDDLIF